MKKVHFKDFDLNNFWDNSEYALEEYIGEQATGKMIKKAEKKLGYKLPESYIFFIKKQNGGTPLKTEFLTSEPTTHADDHIGITGIMGVDKKKSYSVYETEFMIDEWEYPNIGIAICDCPSAGHHMVFLDYRQCGKKGEPTVVHIDQENDYKITFLASNFEEFIRGLIKYKYED